jgi:bacterioferritin
MVVSLKPVTKVSEKLKGMLNDAIAREIQVSIQYMWQHVQVIGVKGIAVQDQFKQTAITEMKHAEKIAERLWYLEGTPTTKPAAIKVGESLKEFLELDTKAEEEAILMYKQIIELAQKEGDAINLYEQMANMTRNKNIRKLLLDVAREEKTHVGEFQALLLIEDKEQGKELEEGKEEVEELMK